LIAESFAAPMPLRLALHQKGKEKGPPDRSGGRFSSGKRKA
jgi:hypothetical protein